MRPIDADALLAQYNLKDATKYGNKDLQQQAHSYDTLMMYEIAEMIKDAPTILDIDKVINKIENDERHTFDGCINKRYVIDLIKGGDIDE